MASKKLYDASTAYFVHICQVQFLLAPKTPRLHAKIKSEFILIALVEN